jgi:hypothetical protein
MLHLHNMYTTMNKYLNDKWKYNIIYVSIKRYRINVVKTLFFSGHVGTRRIIK